MALLAFIVYFNVLSLSQAWVASGKLSLAGSLLGLHGGVFVLATGLLWWRDRGAAQLGFSLRLPRPAAR
jgi:lipopolysaccharide export system permease protein